MTESQSFGMAGSRDLAEQRASELLDQVRARIGDRLAEARLERDANDRLTAIAITVVDPTDTELDEIRAAAYSLGLQDRTRIGRAEPSALTAWEDLRHYLIRLRQSQPGVLEQYPTPTPGYRRPPVRIYLAATGEATAAELDARYGDFVSLYVGALPYPLPPGHPAHHLATERNPGTATVDPARISVALDGPLTIRRGESATHALRLTNLGTDEVTLSTNGRLTASVVDAATGATVGGFAGAQTAPLVTFTAGPGLTIRIPLLVGTASYRPGLGHALPAGPWHLTVPLVLAGRTNLVTPPLPFTITG